MVGKFSPFKRYFGNQPDDQAVVENFDMDELFTDEAQQAVPVLSGEEPPVAEPAPAEPEFMSAESIAAEALDELDEEVDADPFDEPADVMDAVASAVEDMPQAAAQNTRVKTTFLGFDGLEDLDDMDDEPEAAAPSAAAQGAPAGLFPTGWVVIVDGPGRGNSFTLGHGLNGIGRGDDQDISIDFGDTSISRQGHAFIAYDEDEEAFFVGHGGKSNLARLNGKPLLSTEAISNGDQLKIGETVLQLVTLCGDEFSWKSDAA